MYIYIRTASKSGCLRTNCSVSTIIMVHFLQRNRDISSDCKFVGSIVILLLLEIVIFVLTCWNHAPISSIPHLPNHDTLVFTHVLFRHGQRTPEMSSGPYPNDPYINETYEPYGPGSLTNEGKRSVYNMGKFLRKYYNDFLGGYHPGIVYAESSFSVRCRISLLLVLASLFPPPKDLQFKEGFDWQPIEIHYSPRNVDTTFLYLINCPKYNKLLKEESLKAIKNKEVKGFEELATYISSHAGKNYTTYNDIYLLYTYLVVQHERGLKLPEWTKPIFPEPIHSYGPITFTMTARTEELRAVSGGFILRKIVESTKLKLNGNAAFRKRKINLYSGHDFTISHLLGTLGINLEKNPPYVAFLSLEVHKIEGEYGIKLLYQDYSSELPRTLKLPNCEEICPFKKFEQLYGKYMGHSSMCNIESKPNRNNIIS